MSDFNSSELASTFLSNKDDIRSEIGCFLDDLISYDPGLAEYFTGVESLVDVTYDTITPVNYPILLKWYGRLVRMLLYVEQFDFKVFYSKISLLRDYVLDCIKFFREQCRAIVSSPYEVETDVQSESINIFYSMEDF